MFSIRVIVLGVLWVTTGGDAFLPFLTNLYINSQASAPGSAMTAGIPQTVCSWYNLPGYVSSVATQNRGTTGGNVWGGTWLNGRAPVGTALVNSAALPGLMGVLNGVYPSSLTGSTGQTGRPRFVVRVAETNGRGNAAGVNVASPSSANVGGTRELDYYDGDASYYYGDDDYYYGPGYTSSDPDGYTDTVVYYDTLRQTPSSPTVGDLLQTLYGSQLGAANTAGSNACGACTASLLNMLMG